MNGSVDKWNPLLRCVCNQFLPRFHIVETIKDEIGTRKFFNGLRRKTGSYRDALGVWIESLQLLSRNDSLTLSEIALSVEQLSIQVGDGNRVMIAQLQGADSSGSQCHGRSTAESTDSDDENRRIMKLALLKTGSAVDLPCISIVRHGSTQRAIINRRYFKKP